MFDMVNRLIRRQSWGTLVFGTILGLFVFPLVLSQLNARYISVPYTIGDPVYLYVFTKTAHQVWTQILSEGGYPSGGYPDNFIADFKPKPRHFHSAEFWNGSLYVWGGQDKDMYYNDIWRYKIPTFSSDRSKWWELVELWERDITWLKFHNNRYNHQILKEIYEQVCAGAYDSESHTARSDTWERGLETAATSAIGTYDLKPTEDQPDVMPVAGGNPIVKNFRNEGTPQQGAEPAHSSYGRTGFVEIGNWVCEEIKMRYDFMQVPETTLRQDFIRPSARYGSGMRLLYTGVNETYKPGNCKFQSSGNWWTHPTAQHPARVDYSPAQPVPITDSGVYPFHSVYEPRITGIDRRVHWVVPPSCRPQLIMFGGYDVNAYYMSDLWIFDLWNQTWHQITPLPDANPFSRPLAPRKFASLNVYRPGYLFRPPLAPEGQYYNELIYVHGGWGAPPLGAFQDVWAYSREYNQWIDLKPNGRIPSARVYDKIEFIGATGYLIGGVFGAFKIDVMKYNVFRNRFSLMYAAGAKPSARSYFTTSVYKDSIFVFGGRGWPTVDNEDKQDMWQYNSTSNYWSSKEITGIIIPARFGHSCITFEATLIMFGGYSTPELKEMGVGDVNEVWRYDLEIGALLADSQYTKNSGGWAAYQNYVEGDAIIPTHCEDYAKLVGTYWGMPCKVTYDQASEQFLFVDSLHNDTDNPPNGRKVKKSPFLGSNGIGYISAPPSYIRCGTKMYQGRLRYTYMKVYPMEDDELERRFSGTKDDILLVGTYQVLAFDILDKLAPILGKYNLVDVDLDEAKGWFIHGTNGTLKPTKDEFIDVLATLQMILIRVDYYPSIYLKNTSNYHPLGTVLTPEDAYQYLNDSRDGLAHNTSYKLGLDGKLYEYGDSAYRVGTYPEWSGDGVWKFQDQLDQLGRRQTHGEIIAIKTVELFENIAPLSQEFLNAKIEGRLACTTSDAEGETCTYKDAEDPPFVAPLPEAPMAIPSVHA